MGKKQSKPVQTEDMVNLWKKELQHWAAHKQNMETAGKIYWQTGEDGMKKLTEKFFAAADSNRDGKLNQEEFIGFYDQWSNWFNSFDEFKDEHFHQVSEELIAEAFLVADLTGDGMVSLKEWNDFHDLKTKYMLSL